MPYDKESILEHWNDENIESMQDKYIVDAEIKLISNQLSPNSKILDAGCGEGEGTSVYAKIDDTIVHAVDFSETRLKKAKERLAGYDNVNFKQIDFLEEYQLDNDYDFIVSQRMLINLTEWDLQKKVLLGFKKMLKPNGKLIILEGSQDGVETLNAFRAAYGLKPIPVRWHNLFLKDEKLNDFMQDNGFTLTKEAGLGAYFFLTRGIRPIYEENPTWQSDFNKIAISEKVNQLLGFDTQFSRVKLWVYQNNA